jgi:hypothetical protein
MGLSAFNRRRELIEKEKGTVTTSVQSSAPEPITPETEIDKDTPKGSGNRGKKKK